MWNFFIVMAGLLISVGGLFAGWKLLIARTMDQALEIGMRREREAHEKRDDAASAIMASPADPDATLDRLRDGTF